MIIRNVKPADYSFLLEATARWWAEGDTPEVMHPVFVREFGDTGFVAEDCGEIIGFLLGFVSQARVGVAYVHILATDPGRRQRGVSSALYGAFAARVQQLGCRRLLVTISPGNRSAICFHGRLGFECCRQEADVDVDGVPVVSDYSGPGQHRVVMIRNLD